jgi:hypothetical protein
MERQDDRSHKSHLSVVTSILLLIVMMPRFRIINACAGEDPAVAPLQENVPPDKARDKASPQAEAVTASSGKKLPLLDPASSYYHTPLAGEGFRANISERKLLYGPKTVARYPRGILEQPFLKQCLRRNSYACGIIAWGKKVGPVSVLESCAEIWEGSGSTAPAKIGVHKRKKAVRLSPRSFVLYRKFQGKV